MASFNCCFLTCIQVSQEADKVVWYSHLFRIFQFVMIHTVKGFHEVNEAMFLWNSLTLFMIQQMLAVCSLVPLPFLNPDWTSGSSWFIYCCWSLAWRILNITLLESKVSSKFCYLFFFFFASKPLSLVFAQGQLLQALRPQRLPEGMEGCCLPGTACPILLPAGGGRVDTMYACVIKYLLNFVCVSVAWSCLTLWPHGL